MADINFTAGEQKLLMTILANLKGDINADWDKVAELQGYKDASIARTRWSQIRRKKIDANDGDGAKPSPPKKRTKKQTDEEDAEGGGDDGEGKAVKPKKGGRAAKKIKTEIKEDPEDEAESV
ncbi:hypothetical protein BDZ85DRAFT_285091 [Elsinoe ampelina]|uniref:Myb-like domain-containing protein n=1 Tax=Elsinoe ampelina TaxID=302913 RepID=A0A6A6G1Z2_9PEZI|nr:hypothetical protein BDZ85DRAFT_285091 [Elsinoe ampelina]